MVKFDRNYLQALLQVSEGAWETHNKLGAALTQMIEGHPEDALESLAKAKQAIDGAMVSVKWAKTLPVSEDP